MRVTVGKALRVGPGDKVVIQGRLPSSAKLGRLFVFASENGAVFSPYVPNVADVIVADNKPAMLPVMSLRLVGPQSDRELSFTADIDGFICVMQEVDALDEPRANVQLTRIINPDLGWVPWFQRKFMSWQTPKPLS